MAKFQKGISGNPAGKKSGTLNKKTQLAKHFEVHAEALIEKTIELGLSGDPVALRLCIERLVPKAKDRDATVIMPDVSCKETTKIIPKLIQSLAGQEITVSDFKNLIEIFVSHDSEIDRAEQQHKELTICTNDPNEAARIYAQIMRRNF